MTAVPSIKAVIQSTPHPDIIAHDIAGNEYSALGDIDDGLDEGLRSLLGQIGSDSALDDPMRVFTGEFPGISTRFRMWSTVSVAFHGDGRDRDLRALRKPPFQVVV